MAISHKIDRFGSTPSGEAFNVGQMYTLFALAIHDRENHQRTFETAVDVHRLVDAIKQASDKGRQVVCCESFIGDGGGPPGVGLQEQIPNHHKLRG